MKGMKEIMDSTTSFRVFNKCKYDIGVVLQSGRDVNIAAGGFIRLSVDDILNIENACRNRKYFSAKMLVPVDNNGKELTLEDLDSFTDAYTKENQLHLSDEEIEAWLKKPYKAFESWLKKIDDPSELHAVIEVANKIDLPGSKLKLLQARVPNVDLLETESDE